MVSRALSTYSNNGQRTSNVLYASLAAKLIQSLSGHDCGDECVSERVNGKKMRSEKQSPSHSTVQYTDRWTLEVGQVSR